MDAYAGLEHWLDQIALRLEPAQRRELMRRLAQGLRVRHRDRIKLQRDPDGHRFIPRKRNQIGNIKRQGDLFQNIGKELKTEYSADHATVGFGGRTATIAEVHQQGKTIKPSRYAKATNYPIRALVGFNEEDKKWIELIILGFMTIN
ncbi:phage virion morphogenesis protein [Acinetobacter sp. ANC 4169]|uniref:phage virion morphogenesis protein n=1 Tax=Acinetobacter sp. ANC 4169 TaxID=1977879 RepID=UPI000A3484FF|nr:phage virion morphogenesis protein [Acinetobacter sp. ANC 4169]OTG72377.1 phage virion morphogenesis protein [Acinetobacter sp. ANC 4169]